MGAQKPSALLPPVGYRGGKRRLRAFIRPHLQPDQIDLYVEPFVGMGAIYLDLRARGYRGPAILADANPAVADFWSFAHTRGQDLIRACGNLKPTMDPEEYKRAAAAPCGPGVERVARFLWLTNYAFGNNPATYRESGGSWIYAGTSLTSAAKYGHTFSWLPRVVAVRKIVEALDGLPCLVLGSAEGALALAKGAHVYADPPYEGSRDYEVGAGRSAYVLSDHAERVAGATSRAEVVLLSEQSPDALPCPPWTREATKVVARISQGRGAAGKRGEYLFRWGRLDEITRKVSTRIRARGSK